MIKGKETGKRGGESGGGSEIAGMFCLFLVLATIVCLPPSALALMIPENFTIRSLDLVILPERTKKEKILMERFAQILVPLLGSRLSTGSQKVLIARAESLLRKAGWGEVRVFFPAQTFRSGHLTMGIAIPQLGRVTFSNPSRVSDRFLSGALSEEGVVPGRTLDIDSIEQGLYDLGQIPGVAHASGTLSAGSAPFSSDLAIGITPASPFAGSTLEVDDYGYAYTGSIMLNATGEIGSGIFPGDLFTVQASSSFFGMNSGTVSYSIPVLYNTWQTGVDFNAMNYALGYGLSPFSLTSNADVYKTLGASGSNTTLDLWIGRQAGNDTTSGKVKIMGILKNLTDNYGAGIDNQRTIGGGSLELAGVATSRYGSFAADLTDMEYDLVQGPGSSTLNPFYYSSAGLHNFATENLSETFFLDAARTNLVAFREGGQEEIGGGAIDPMLQAVLGGMGNVRALASGVAFGNNLYDATATLTHLFPLWKGQWGSSLFFDWGRVTGNGANYSGQGPGFEEFWTGPHLFAKLDLAVPVGPLPSNLTAGMPALVGGNTAGTVPLEFWFSLGARQ